MVTNEQIEHFKNLARMHKSPAVKLTTVYLILSYENNTTEQRFMELCAELLVEENLTKVKNAVFNNSIMEMLVENIENIYDNTEAHNIAYRITVQVRLNKARASKGPLLGRVAN